MLIWFSIVIDLGRTSLNLGCCFEKKVYEFGQSWCSRILISSSSQFILIATWLGLSNLVR